MELYRDITEHFIRISYVDALKNSKISVPLKKKQALRSKVQALGKRKDPKKGKYEKEEDNFSYGSCGCNCEWEPANTRDQSNE